MNKAKLVELADEVLADIEPEIRVYMRQYLEEKICEKLSNIFASAQYALTFADNKERQKNYKSVKPILDDCIDKLLGETK
tara:strand:+ start:764 stop:1003 length:240 start_codon:yes stop_codon:yes gene_type:complete